MLLREGERRGEWGTRVVMVARRFGEGEAPRWRTPSGGLTYRKRIRDQGIWLKLDCRNQEGAGETLNLDRGE